jgi:AraC family transcriptional activator of pobA
MPLTRTSRRQIPSFSLYGEHKRAGDGTDPLHIEDIHSRSRKYLWTIATHRHVGLCQCVYLSTGAVTRDLEDSRATFAGPVAIVVPAGAVHAFAFRAESQGYVLTFDLARLLSDLGTPQQAPIAALFSMPRTLELADHAAESMRIAAVFECLLQEFRQPEGFKSPVIGWLASSALWLLAAQAARVEPRVGARHANGGKRLGASASSSTTAAAGRDDLARLWRFRQLIEQHYAQHWTVERYAGALALSATSLNRLCRSLTGSTATAVIQQRLMLECRRRLVYLPMSVGAIAAELGFKDPAYFSRFFRKHSRMSPSEFRQRREAGG